MNIRRINIRDYANKLGISYPESEELEGHEDEVGERAIVPILRTLNYRKDDINRKPSLGHIILKERKRYPDYGVYEYNSKKFGLVFSIKKHGKTLTGGMVEEVCGWCGLAGSSIGCLTNGIDLVVIKPIRGVVSWDYLDGIPEKSNLKAELGEISYSEQDQTYATRVVEELTPETIHNIADHCHDVIRRKKGTLIPDRLYEFSKIILMRIMDERRFRSEEQTELRMSSTFIKNLKKRDVNIRDYFQESFSSITDL